MYLGIVWGTLWPWAALIPVLAESPNSRRVVYHNIFAVQPQEDRLGYDGDGVVEIASAKREDFNSQLMIEATHTTAHRHPLTILELQRILKEHLEQIENPHGIQLIRRETTSPGYAAPQR